MNHKTIIALIAATIFCCCAPESTDEANGIIVFDNNKEYPVMDLKLSDIADIEFVQLKDEDSAFISQPNFSRHIYLGDNCIIMGNYTVYHPTSFGIYKFDGDGKFICRITGFGRGPGEVDTFAKMSVEGDSCLFLASALGSDIIMLDLHGNFLQSWRQPRGHSETQFIGNNAIIYDRISRYISSSGKTTERGAPLKMMDLNSSEITTLLPHEISNGIIRDNREGFQNTKMMGDEPNLIKLNNGLYFHSFRFDTVYFIGKDLRPTPKIAINKIYREDEYYSIYPLVETDDYILLRDCYNDYTITQYGKDENQYIYLKDKQRIYRIANSFKPEKFMDNAKLLLQNEVRIASGMLSLNQNIFTIALTHETLMEQYEYLPSKVKAMADTMTEDSNPVIMFIKFRPMGK